MVSKPVTITKPPSISKEKNDSVASPDEGVALKRDNVDETDLDVSENINKTVDDEIKLTNLKELEKNLNNSKVLKTTTNPVTEDEEKLKDIIKTKKDIENLEDITPTIPSNQGIENIKSIKTTEQPSKKDVEKIKATNTTDLPSKKDMKNIKATKQNKSSSKEDMENIKTTKTTEPPTKKLENIKSTIPAQEDIEDLKVKKPTKLPNEKIKVITEPAKNDTGEMKVKKSIKKQAKDDIENSGKDSFKMQFSNNNTLFSYQLTFTKN